MGTDKSNISELKEMIQVILLAIPREIYSREYYLSASKKTSSKESKELFISLAEEEKKHERQLRWILNQLETKLKDISK